MITVKVAPPVCCADTDLPFLETSKDEYLLAFVCLQRGGGIWAEENDGGKVRGEPSRDFAKVIYQQRECFKSGAVRS